MSLFRKWLTPFTEAEDGDEEIDRLIRRHLSKTLGSAEPPLGVWWKLRARLAAGPTDRRGPRPRFWRAFLQRTQPLAATALLLMLVGAALVREQIGLPYDAGPTRSRPTAIPSAQVVEVEPSPRYTVLERRNPLPDGGMVSVSPSEGKETRPAMPKILTLGKPREVRPS